MRIKCVACEALARTAYHGAARSPHTIDIELLRLGLHDTPADLRQRLQDAIDRASAGAAYDAVVLLYGLCGKATDGVRARAVPVVLPRVHDCIAMFLGSRVRYQEEFSRCPGTYWYVADYIERGRGSDAASAIGGSSDDGIRKMQREFVDTYGAENAAYLMEVLGGWSRHYSRAVFIDMGIGGSGEAERVARAEAERRGWTFERRSGDAGLVCRLLAGDWGDDFLVLQPGQRVAESYDDGAIRASDG